MQAKSEVEIKGSLQFYCFQDFYNCFTVFLIIQLHFLQTTCFWKGSVCTEVSLFFFFKMGQKEIFMLYHKLALGWVPNFCLFFAGYFCHRKACESFFFFLFLNLKDFWQWQFFFFYENSYHVSGVAVGMVSLQPYCKRNILLLSSFYRWGKWRPQYMQNLT